MFAKPRIIHSPDSDNMKFKSGIVNCSGEDNKKKRYDQARKKLRKIGFDPEELSKDLMIKMNKENFAIIAEEQLKNTKVLLPKNQEKLPHMKTFTDNLTLDKKILSAMAFYKIEEPTPVQSVVIPYITEKNCDLIIQAQTGSGKTHAFLLPIIDYIIKAKSNQREYSANTTSPYAIIVAPTKELALQIACDATRLTQDVKWRVGVTFSIGGYDPKDASKMINAGCDILVVTVGRLFDYFGEHERQNSRLNTANLKFVVLDEADTLLKPGNGRQSPGENQLKQSDAILYDFIVNRLTYLEKRDFRCLLFSATVDMQAFEPYVVNGNTINIKVGGSHANFTVEQSFVEIKHEHDKQEVLMDIIDSIAWHYKDDSSRSVLSDEIKQKIGKTIIFVNHKRRSDRLAHALIAKGFSCMSINSDRSASQRLDALKDLMTGAIDILVSTNVLARGLNIPRVDYIINYDLPNEFSGSEYVHRIGRCARLGNLGKSITLFNPSTDSYWSNDLIEGCKAANQHVPALLRDSVNIPKRSPLKYRRQNEEDHYARNQNPYYCGGKHSPSSSNCYGY